MSRQSTIFGLGIMPYISASIIFQLLVTVVPALEKLQKEGDAGRKKIRSTPATPRSAYVSSRR
jgi:preprotein translocase subunit SecY